MNNVRDFGRFEITDNCPNCNEYTTILLYTPGYKNQIDSENAISILATYKYGDWLYGVCESCESPVLIKSGKEVTSKQKSSLATIESGIPEHIRRDIEEAEVCLNVKANKACILMSRRIIQKAVSDKGTKNRILQELINDFESSGMIPVGLKKWLNIITWLESSPDRPDSDRVTYDEALNTFKFLKKFLSVIYFESDPELVKNKIQNPRLVHRTVY